MIRTERWLLVLAASSAVLFGACGESGVSPELPRAGDPVLGRAAFVAECAGCHASGDGLDLAFFGFSDTTIVRRAVAHVDTATALDIVAHVRTLPPARADRDERHFQPGGRVLDGDVAFAMELFGRDAWPEDLDSDGLRAIDPLETAVAVAMPLWSSEVDDLDWMPSEPPPEAVLDYRGGVPRARIDAYYRSEGLPDLVDAVVALRFAERDPASPDAPCVMEPIDRLQPRSCFETRRWISTLGAQYMLRYGINTPVNAMLHDTWWDVGNAARRSIQQGAPIDDAVDVWTSWMWVGWMFEPSRHASVYLARGLAEQGLFRHATFHALRAQVARPMGAHQAYQDVVTAARFTPDTWLLPAVRFGYGHVLERLRAGDELRGERLEEARVAMERAYRIVSNRIDDAEALADVRRLRDEALAMLR